MKTGVWVGAFALVAACSSFSAGDNADGAGGADGGRLPDGAPAPATGIPFADLSIDFEVAQVTRGTKVTVPVHVTRGNSYTGRILVKLVDLPPTMSATEATLENPAVDGELSLTIAPNHEQGALAGVSIVADGVADPKPHTSRAFAPFVKGKPGEVDTTFAAGGVLTIGENTLGGEFDVDGDGRILVMNDRTLVRYDANGAKDESFAAVTFPLQRPELIARRGNAIFVARNQTGDSLTWGGWITKLSAAGMKDMTYGAGSGAVLAGGWERTAFGFGNDGRSISFYPDTTYGSRFHAYDDAGTQKTPASDLLKNAKYNRGVAFLTDHSVVVAGDRWVMKLDPTSALDTTFGSAGFLDVGASIVLNDIVKVSDDAYIVTGRNASDGTLPVMRVTKQGKIDTTFVASSAPVVAKPEPLVFRTLFFGDYASSFVGRLSLDGAGGIIQAGQVEDGGITKCVVMRYAKDGGLDRNFGSNGVSRAEAPGCYAHRVAVQPDGRIIVGGPILTRLWN